MKTSDALLIKTPQQKKAEVIALLKTSFDSLADSKNVLKQHKLETEDLNLAYQKIGVAIMDLAKVIKNHEQN